MPEAELTSNGRLVLLRDGLVIDELLESCLSNIARLEDSSDCNFSLSLVLL